MSQLTQKPTIQPFILATVFLCLSALYGEQLPYEPVLGDPLKESWCWKELIVDHPVDITEVCPSQNGDLWLGVRDGILLYRDDAFQFHGREKGMLEAQTTQIVELPDGRILSVTGGHLFSYQNDRWSRVDLGDIEIGFSQRIFAGKDGCLYVPHSEGLVIQWPDGKTESLELDVQLRSMVEDDSGNLWAVCGTLPVVYQLEGRQALYKDPGSWIEKYRFTQPSERSLLFNDQNGSIWYFDNNFSVSPMSYSLEDNNWILHDLNELGGSNSNSSITKTHDGALWIASRGVLHKYAGQQWEIYNSPQYDIPASFPRLCVTIEGDLLVVETGHVIQKIDYSRSKWKSYTNLHFQDEGADGTRWFLSSEGDVISKNAEGQGFFRHNLGDQRIEYPMVIKVTQGGEVWCIGSHSQKTAICKYKEGNWKRTEFENFAFGVSHMSVFESPDGDIYLGCGEQNPWNAITTGGILQFKKVGKDFEVIRHTPPVVPFRPVGIIGIPGDDSIWLGGHGVYAFDGQGSTLITNEFGLDGSWVDNIHGSADGRLLITSWGKGIHQLKDGEWTLFTQRDGLTSDFVSQLLCADDMIIAATNEGLCRLDGDRWFPFMSGAIHLNREAGYLKQDKAGQIWINLSPIEWFYRGLIRETARPISRGEFKTIVYMGDQFPPQTVINEEKNSRFYDTVPSIEWSGADLWESNDPQGMTFSWRVNGGDWTAFSHLTESEFPDLEHGWHTMEVRSRDIDFNVDPQPASLRFQVVRPFYRQRWFIPSQVLALILFIVMVSVILRQRILHLLEIEEVKIRFFTNISHELRTPLTLILGPIEKAIIRSQNPENKQDLSLAYKHAQRLRDLVDQLLDFRKAETGVVVTETTVTSLPDFFSQILQSFESVIIDKHQRLVFHSRVIKAQCLLDQDKIQKVVYNLLSNSVKYTQNGGRIDFHLDVQKAQEEVDQLLIKVTNNGPTIGPDSLRRIFEPYYQVSESSVSLQRSSGIGLALTKELIEILGGDIEATSPVLDGAGCQFKIQVPVKFEPGADFRDDWLEWEIGTSDGITSLVSERNPDEDNLGPNQLSVDETRVLLVEDNEEILKFLENELRPDFEIICARNGQEGLVLARRHVPDIIISDVMMPEMNGFELCQSIKSDQVTNHIPLLLLTALNSSDYVVRGLESGAVDYLSKPVSPVQLKLKVRNILESRAQLRERLKNQYIPELAKDPEDSEERAFLDHARQLVEERIADPLFGVDELSDKLAMSRSALYRKFKAITDKSPAAFIKAIRLKRASEFLLEERFNITEVAFKTGFSDSSTFSRAFKEYFKLTPKAYREKAR